MESIAHVTLSLPLYLRYGRQMVVDIIYDDPRWEDLTLDAWAQTACAATLAHLNMGAGDWEIAILACDDVKIAQLNGDFRDKAKPTNVLSWPSEERGVATDGDTPDLPTGPDPELGDIAIAYETCLQEARDYGKSIHDHVTHLIIHATLHLLGYDHIRDLDATLMEGIEVEILGKLGISNPY